MYNIIYIFKGRAPDETFGKTVSGGILDDFEDSVPDSDVSLYIAYSIRPTLQFCDDERTVAYLETNKEANVGLYQHYGFDLMREEPIPKTPVMHYSMVRNPKVEK